MTWQDHLKGLGEALAELPREELPAALAEIGVTLWLSLNSPAPSTGGPDVLVSAAEASMRTGMSKAKTQRPTLRWRIQAYASRRGTTLNPLYFFRPQSPASAPAQIKLVY